MNKNLFSLSVLLISFFLITACGGGFNGPGSTGASTVKAVKALASQNPSEDETKVTLTGNIVKQIDDEHYTFKDSTGTITVEIEKEKFIFSKVTPETEITITGDIEIEPSSVKIDVEKLKIAK